MISRLDRAACLWLAAVGAVAFTVAFAVTVGSAGRDVPPRAASLSAPPAETSSSVPERPARLRAVPGLPAVLRRPRATPTPPAATLVVAPEPQVIDRSDSTPPTEPAPIPPAPSRPAPPPAPPPAATPAPAPPEHGPTFDSSG
jgi:hypothetical protein